MYDLREMLAVLWFIAAIVCYGINHFAPHWALKAAAITSVIFSIIYFISSMYYSISAEEEEPDDADGSKTSGPKKDE